MAFAEGVAEGPIPMTNGKGSFLFSARRSYFDLLMGLASEYKKTFEVFPNYYDFAYKIYYQLTQSHKLTLTGLWASDNMISKPDEKETDVTNNTDWYTDKAVFSTGLESTFGKDFFSQLVFSISRGKTFLSTGNLWHDKNIKTIFSLHEDITWKIHTNHILKLGAVFEKRHQNVSTILPDITDLQDRLRPNIPITELEVADESLFSGVYLVNDWCVTNPFKIQLSLRSDYFHKTKEWSLSPRIGAALMLNEELVLRAAWGIYYQSPQLKELSKSYGNPDLLSRRAQHFLLGLEYELPFQSNVRLEGFYKIFDRLPLEETSHFYTNQGKGYSYGFGLSFQIQAAEKLNGWASYTYTVAKRQEYRNLKLIPPDFDIPHIASVVATCAIGSGWQLGIKWLFASGRPSTPIIGAVADTGSKYYMPIFGETNSQRMPAYHALDVRLLKEFNFSGWNLTLFLEVLNAYNRRNVAAYKWNRNYSERSIAGYYPIIPSLGIIAEF